MSPKYVLHTPPPANPHESQPTSTFMPPIFIEMGDEGGEFLEAKIKDETGETVRADVDWTPLSGTRSIDTSVVGGFMFQSDAGSECSIQVVEDGKLPVQILIDRDQDFGQFLVAIQRHEEWKTSGDFHLRFLRRVPILDKRCTAYIKDGPFAGPVPSLSDSGTSITEAPGSSTADAITVEDKEEEQKAADRATGTRKSFPGPTSSDLSFKDAYIVPLAGPTGTSEKTEESTDEEDHLGIGAAALKGTGGGIIPPGMFPPPR
ncbi:hypothetical protein HO133_004835 [Letharia lupina]|uniref:Uncharacterized protein n=1 Tax=Letharia lupina TaxID=560253 RepID=A0A8H6L014_9LECA|nr:uncharacterized protein HO133_004835 [Letharia lupina]KAF6230491.1 hypothetical protein HO133_004835 [Letharia lupina]